MKSHPEVAISKSGDGTLFTDTVLVPAMLAADWLHPVHSVRNVGVGKPAACDTS